MEAAAARNKQQKSSKEEEAQIAPLESRQTATNSNANQDSKKGLKQQQQQADDQQQYDAINECADNKNIVAIDEHANEQDVELDVDFDDHNSIGSLSTSNSSTASLTETTRLTSPTRTTLTSSDDDDSLDDHDDILDLHENQQQLIENIQEDDVSSEVNVKSRRSDFAHLSMAIANCPKRRGSGGSRTRRRSSTNYLLGGPNSSSICPRRFSSSLSCHCEQVINGIDCDGLPVTDVDLVTYKQLCQMEQQAHHLARSRNHQLQANNKQQQHSRYTNLVFMRSRIDICDNQSNSMQKMLCSRKVQRNNSKFPANSHTRLFSDTNSMQLHLAAPDDNMRSSISNSINCLNEHNSLTTSQQQTVNNNTASSGNFQESKRAHRNSCSTLSIASPLIINQQQSGKCEQFKRKINPFTSRLNQSIQQQQQSQQNDENRARNGRGKLHMPLDSTSLILQPTNSSDSSSHYSASTSSFSQAGQSHSKHKHVGLVRRSSLQEESGAYYELCIPAEEQLICAKYAWFPRSLAKLPNGFQLIDQFFACFPRDKIPYASLAAAAAAAAATSAAAETSKVIKESCETNNEQIDASANNRVALQRSVSSASANNQSIMKNVSSARNSIATALHPVASSHRDEQISYQLARQDISLDYCSYPMSAECRKAYAEFVHMRNCNSLDVARVIQVTNAINNNNTSQQTTATILALSTTASSASLAISGVTNDNQLSTTTTTTTNEHKQNHLLIGGERCRRCLVRFESGQLAVAAPNFLLGSPAFNQQNTTLEASLTHSSKDISQRRGKQSEMITQLHSNVALFHPQCFTCATCKEFLVDLVYCLQAQKLYCFRHYGESLRPRCNWCQEVSIIQLPVYFCSNSVNQSINECLQLIIHLLSWLVN